MKNEAAVQLGKSGGLKTSEKKTEACRKNARKSRFSKASMVEKLKDKITAHKVRYGFGQGKYNNGAYYWEERKHLKGKQREAHIEYIAWLDLIVDIGTKKI